MLEVIDIHKRSLLAFIESSIYMTQRIHDIARLLRPITWQIREILILQNCFIKKTAYSKYHQGLKSHISITDGHLR